jgi:DNA-binding winged helix-turn-helix (wHTH) protein/tetratricopeptide (TPR) repeat protein
MSQKGLYEFGEFRLDLGDARLLRDGAPVPLPPKTFELLAALVSRAGKLVEKDTLIKEVWAETFVEEGNVARHVWALRQALGDDALIETVPKRGYRFTAPVRLVEPVPDVVIQRRTQTRVVQAEETIIQDEPAPALPAARRRNVFARPAVAAAVVAGFIAAVAAAGWGSSARTSPPLTSRDYLLIGDIENRTGDPVFDGTVRQALASQLEQSPFLRVFGDERMRQALALMARSSDERVTGTVAREMCQRQGIKAMLQGEIAALGSRYVVSLDALECASGDSIAHEQVEAAGKEQVLSALGDAAARLRETLGESVASIQEHHTPIAQATTSSLDALKAYTLAAEQRRKGGPTTDSAALPFLKRAIELDPDFAMAYYWLAQIYRNAGPPELAAEYATAAYERRQRATDMERLAITAVYHHAATRDVPRAIEAYDIWQRTYPNDSRPANSLSILYHNDVGDLEKSVEQSEEAVRRDPQDAGATVNLGAAYLGIGDVDKAKAVFERAVGNGVLPAGEPRLYAIAFMAGDAAGMQREIEAANGSPTEGRMRARVANAAEFQGRFREGRALRRSEQDNRGKAAALLADSQQLAEAGNVDLARRRYFEALAFDPGQARRAGYLSALFEEPRIAVELITSAARHSPGATVLHNVTLPIARATLELRGGRPAKAIEHLEAALPYDRSLQGPRAILLRGAAYLQLGAGAEAAAEFKKITERRPRFATNLLYPVALVHLARAFTLTGDHASAAKAYEEFLMHWKNADSDLPLLIQAKREYAALKKST